MSVAAIAAIKPTAMNTAVATSFSAITTGGCTIPIGKDERLAIVAVNANAAAKTLTVAKGTGVNAAAADLVITIPAPVETVNQMVVFELDSSRYGQTTGYFNITSNAGADVSIMAIQLR